MRLLWDGDGFYEGAIVSSLGSLGGNRVVVLDSRCYELVSASVFHLLVSFILTLAFILIVQF